MWATSSSNFARAVKPLPGSPPVWLLAAALLAAAARPAGRPAEPPQPLPASLRAPKPAPADRNILAAAFTKAAPQSIADLKSMERHVQALVAQVSPTVVAVELGSTSGSGVVISDDGLVLTAGHVCGRPGRDVRFRFADGRTARGRTLGVDRDSDTGLMRITGPGPWPHAALGELEQARIGDWVLALGHPGGFDPRRSLVVRLGRIIRLEPEALQTDCPISLGDSGGPLFDMYGRVVGIHSAISASPAQNFHVSVSEFYQTWDELVKTEAAAGAPDRPAAYLGATVLDDGAGCRIGRVQKDSPASRAGLRAGDRVLKVNDRDILAPASFRRWIAETAPSETLRLEVSRGGKVLSLTVKLESRSAGKP